MLVRLFIQAAIVALFGGAFLGWRKIQSFYTDKTSKVFEVACMIKEGSMTYLTRQLKVLALVKAIFAIFLLFFINKEVAIAFIIGGLFSWMCGFIGMYVSTEANHKVAFLAKKGFHEAFDGAFLVGKIVGYLVTGVALFSVYAAYEISHFWMDSNKFIEILIGMSFGASLVSIFARLGGGIFTKGADVGADLVGKIEANIPEDDPRNPAVIADNVGDNVGDCAGMAADLFESYIVMVSSAITLAFCLFDSFLAEKYTQVSFSILAAGAFAGIFVLTQGWNIKENAKFSSLEIALRTGYISAIFVTSAFGFLFWGTPNIYNLLLCSLIGIALSVIIMPLIEYFTSSRFRPVKSIAHASKSGHATNIIQGIAVGLESCFVPLLLIAAGVATSVHFAGVFGLAITCLSMLSICSVVLALDAFGPVTDNAGGLVEMGGLPEEARIVTDRLDALGNMTKATTKGYAVFSAALAALVLCTTYRMDLEHMFGSDTFSMDLTSDSVVIGLFVGAAIVSLFTALAMQAVGRCSIAIVEEVRNQFREMPGILAGTQKPHYAKAIDMLTKASLREMIAPGLLPIVGVVGCFAIMKVCFGNFAAFKALGGLIIGSSLVGIFVAFSMTTGGGAWDNAKKYIESSEGKGSDAHKAAVTGDTVGDPYKDTAGPAINPMIKLIALVAFLCVMASR